MEVESYLWRIYYTELKSALRDKGQELVEQIRRRAPKLEKVLFVLELPRYIQGRAMAIHEAVRQIIAELHKIPAAVVLRLEGPECNLWCETGSGWGSSRDGG